jgi:hypothetical protein
MAAARAQRSASTIDGNTSTTKNSNLEFSSTKKKRSLLPEISREEQILRTSFEDTTISQEAASNITKTWDESENIKKKRNKPKRQPQQFQKLENITPSRSPSKQIQCSKQEDSETATKKLNEVFSVQPP